MGKKKKAKCGSDGPNMSYMISFGDTMTALLAFFIVLNSLAEEQTGAKLHAGTGSFITMTHSFGLPGKMIKNRSRQAFQLDQMSPANLVADPEGQIDAGQNRGPDEDPDDGRIIDRQKEEFTRFLQEIRRVTDVRPEPGIAGEANFDVLGSLPHDGPLMNNNLEAALKGVAPTLRRADYEVEITVWATTPSVSAWTRAVRQADQIRREAIDMLRLPEPQQRKLTAIARPWISEDLKRPSVTVTARRTRPARAL